MTKQTGVEKHTPTPWRVAEAWQFPDDAGRVFDAVVKRFKNGTESLVCSFEHSVFRESQKANVEFIVRAVNAHEELVEALEDARNVIKHSVRRDVFTYKQHILDKIDTALARVEGSES